MLLKWQLNQHEGSCTLQQETHIVVSLKNEVIEKGETVLEIAPAEKMFFNGYQTWTWCPEYSAKDVMPRIRLNGRTVRKYGFDRYGDYHFAHYSRKKGIFHGYSYCYFRNGDKYELFASLDEDPGYTVFYYDSHAKQLCIQRDAQGLKVNGEYHLLDLFHMEGTEKEVFDEWFRRLNIKPRTLEGVTGYSSWYNRYEDITQKTIEEDLEGCGKILKEGDLFQVDDGWEPTVGDWLEEDKDKFPCGMKMIADSIHAKGYKAGLWLAPFVATAKSKVWKEHPDWFLLHQGQPWSNGSNWGGFYSLDLDREEVREHIRKVFSRVFDDWGFDLVKLDFLYAGAPFGNEKATRAGRMHEQMQFIREVCGDKLILGCGVPLMPAFGLVDYCRISCDVSLDWDDRMIMRLAHLERVSTRHAIDNTVYRRQLNGRAFLNDPDVFFLRDDNISLTSREKEYLATVNALFGGILLTSDNPGKYDEDKRAKFEYYRELAKVSNATLKDGMVTYEDDKGVHQFPFCKPE